MISINLYDNNLNLLGLVDIPLFKPNNKDVNFGKFEEELEYTFNG